MNAGREPGNALLTVDGVTVRFSGKWGAVRPVDDVSFQLDHGETLAVVGESGSGKSVTCLSIMRLLSGRNVNVEGSVRFKRGQETALDLLKASDAKMRQIRGAEISMIFQEPMTSLNPLLTVGDQIAEMLMLHGESSRQVAFKRAGEMLELVEIPAARSRLRDHPHQMSGGMRQRVMIGMALACNPRLLIADEPTTALDVTVQAQILDLIRRLQRENRMGVLFVTHDLGVVSEMADHVAVMYAGKVVEQAPVEEIFEAPKHPYTADLISCTPAALHDLNGNSRLMPIPGAIPSLTNLPTGCRYSPRCAYVQPKCTQAEPDLEKISPTRRSRCWRYNALPDQRGAK